MAILVATGLTTALGLYRSGHRGLWLDEAFSVTVFRDVSWPAFWDYTSGAEANMSLYHLLLRLWPLDETESQLRSLSTVFAALVIPTTFFLTRRLVGRACAMVATVILSAQPFLMEFAQEARGYTLVLLVSTLSILLMLRAVERPSAQRNSLWAICAAAGFYAHFFFAYIFVLEIAFLLWQRARLGTWLAVAAASVGVAPLGLFIWTHPGQGAYSWMGPADPAWMRSTFVVLIANNWLLAVLVTIGGCVLLWDLARKPASRATLSLIGGMAALPVVMVVVSHLAYPMTSVRYYLLILPALITFAALAITRAPWRWLRTSLAVAGVSTSLFLAISQHDQQAPWKVDVRGATKYLDTAIKPGERVFAFAPDVQVYDYYRLHGSGGRAFRHLPPLDDGDGAPSGVWIISRGDAARPVGFRRTVTKTFAGGLLLDHWQPVGQ